MSALVEEPLGMHGVKSGVVLVHRHHRSNSRAANWVYPSPDGLDRHHTPTWCRGGLPLARNKGMLRLLVSCCRYCRDSRLQFTSGSGAVNLGVVVSNIPLWGNNRWRKVGENSVGSNAGG